MDSANDKIFSISEFIQLLNIGLKTSKARIIGEVGEAKSGPTGHMYFTMKDEKDGGMLNCIIWRSKYSLYGLKLQEGMKIMASGYPEIYAPSGRLSFIAETIEPAGEGALKKEYERLKAKLKEEGIFDLARKREIPKYPQRIGVITSKQGAVLADFLNNLGRFGFKVKMIDSRVEGQAAVADLLASIKTFKKEDIEVLVIMRGGGSLEAMMAFNNELLVREMADFPVPVIAAIGHDRDVSLVAMAADLAVSTPTAAANRLSESWEQALLFLERYERDIIGRYGQILEDYREIENKFRFSLQNFKNTLLNAKINFGSSLKKSFSGFRILLAKTKEKLEYAEKTIEFNNPERQLKLGYCIASSGGKIIRKVGDVKVGENLDVKVLDGAIVSEIKKINKIL
ncbi:MAG: exodeoxyribonuclease VII large subunit [Candidatus Parcubacteria bacterium]|nr:exodeoxyribonuclease VII large subunit [Candidatus Parcubacteria bacterium]